MNNPINTVYVGTHKDSNIQIPGKSVIHLSYSGSAFYVINPDNGDFRSVPRNNVVGDFRNAGEVLSQILMVLNCSVDSMVVSIDASAKAEIDLIWEANIVLFPFPGSENT